jgi:hypothetical protein
MTTVTFTLPSVASVTSADWGAVFHRWARVIAAVLAVPYVAGLMAGEAWHRLLNWFDAHHLAGLARLGLPGGNYPEIPDGSAGVTIEVIDCRPDLCQRLSPALPPARSTSNVAPPRTGIIHISDPMARAVRMVHEGKSQRLAAQLCGVSRSSLQRAFKA